MKHPRKIVKKLDPNLDENSTGFNAAMVLIGASQVGTNADAIAKRTGLPRRKVREITGRCRDGGLFKNGKIVHGGWFDKDGGIAFWLDVCVAEGMMRRVRGKSSAASQTPEST